MAFMANDVRLYAGTVDTYGEAASRLQTACQSLNTNMQQLQGMWTGEAHEALASRFEGDYQQLLRLVEYTSKYSQALGEAESEYTQCDRQVTSLIDSVRI